MVTQHMTSSGTVCSSASIPSSSISSQVQFSSQVLSGSVAGDWIRDQGISSLPPSSSVRPLPFLPVCLKSQATSSYTLPQHQILTRLPAPYLPLKSIPPLNSQWPSVTPGQLMSLSSFKVLCSTPRLSHESPASLGQPRSPPPGLMVS